MVSLKNDVRPSHPTFRAVSRARPDARESKRGEVKVILARLLVRRYLEQSSRKAAA